MRNTKLLAFAPENAWPPEKRRHHVECTVACSPFPNAPCHRISIFMIIDKEPKPLLLDHYIRVIWSGTKAFFSRLEEDMEERDRVNSFHVVLAENAEGNLVCRKKTCVINPARNRRAIQ